MTCAHRAVNPDHNQNKKGRAPALITAPLIHTFGDSHSKHGWNNSIKKHHIGPCLCYSFGQEKLNRCNINNFNINNGDSIVFCFGEIDCRCHIHKYISVTKSYQTIIDEIVTNYIDAILLNIQNCKVKLKNICIYNIIPPTQTQQYIIKKDPFFPHLGSDKERKMYVLYFNKLLKEYCVLNNWIFFDIYENYTDENGFLNKKFSYDNVHISNGIFIDKFIKDNI